IRQANRYVGAARNAGIRAAGTTFVILLDDDNVAFPDMVRSLRTAIERTQADVVTCGLRHFHDATNAPSAALPADDHVFSGGPLLLGAIHNCFGDASGIYRRAVFDRIGAFHERSGVSFEDWHLHLRVVAAGLRLVSLPEPLVWYRIRPASMLRSTRRYDNARVIAEFVGGLPGGALEPLADLLMGLEEHQSTTATHAAGLEAALAAARDAHATATAYAHSLERALADVEAYALRLEGALKAQDPGG
ncbi:MAG: glycosyltransferase, partial [Proteobacteria bacterium]|nr:glycosyltransferase [Pseudomonadota bacterium]